MTASQELVESVVDAARATAAQGRHTPFEHAMAVLDLLRLSREGDCYYDRPAIGIQYALWYHCQRSNDVYQSIAADIAAAGQRQRPLQILDIGAGTGATLSAVRLACDALVADGQAVPPSIRMVAVESSPFMLDMLEAVDASFSGRLSDAVDLELEIQRRSWFDPRWDGPADMEATLIVAAYAFDHSDTDLNDTLVQRLRRLGDLIDAEALVLLGPWAKHDILDGIRAGLATDDPHTSSWEQVSPAAGPRAETGAIPAARTARRELCRGSNLADNWLQRPPSWDNDPRSYRFLRAPATLLTPPARHHGFALDDQQERAATPGHEGVPRPVVIVGAAGSGKSYVLAERVARTYDPDERRVLVTAFNKPMVDLLGSILHKRLGNEVDLVHDDAGFWFDRKRGDAASNSPLVLCNRDKLPTRIFGRTSGSSRWSVGDHEGEWFIYGKGPTYDKGPATRSGDDLLRPMFQLEDYLPPFSRVGAGTRMGEAERRRLWEDFWDDNRSWTFARARAEALRHALANPVEPPPFTDVFIDECQDYSEADYRLLRTLVEDPGSIVAAGDETQSLHLGGTYARPTLHRVDGTATVWVRHELVGAYRMPVATCRAVAPLAAAVHEKVTGGGAAGEDICDPEPRKAAAWGPRPVVVAVDPSSAEGLRPLEEALRTLRPFLANAEATVTEAPAELAGALAAGARRADFIVKRSHMRLLKGQEREVVIVPAAHSGHPDDTFLQCFYTAVTRSTRMLVLAITPQVPDEVRDVLGLMSRDTVMPWDEAAKELVDAMFR